MTETHSSSGDGLESRPAGSEHGEESRALRREPSLPRVTWEWTKSILVAFVLFLVIRTFVVEAFKIPTSSMENTLLVGDFLLVNKAVYGAQIPGTGITLPAFAVPQRGEVIVFNPPHDLSKNYVKRLVGLPGDTLEMRAKNLYVNRVRVEEPYARHMDGNRDAVHPGMSWQLRHLHAEFPSRRYRPSRDTWGPIVVPDEQFFVLGDNRDNSEDSRYWGFVDREAIRGKPWFVYYSFDPSGAQSLQWAREIRWERIGGAIR
jgi:signal peptidase I